MSFSVSARFVLAPIGRAVSAILEISERRLKDMSSLLSFRSKLELAVFYKNRILALRS